MNIVLKKCFYWPSSQYQSQNTLIAFIRPAINIAHTTVTAPGETCINRFKKWNQTETGGRPSNPCNIEVVSPAFLTQCKAGQRSELLPSRTQPSAALLLCLHSQHRLHCLFWHGTPQTISLKLDFWLFLNDGEKFDYIYIFWTNMQS